MDSEEVMRPGWEAYERDWDSSCFLSKGDRTGVGAYTAFDVACDIAQAERLAWGLNVLDEIKKVTRIEELESDTIKVGDFVEFSNIPSGKVGVGKYGIFKRVPGIGACFVGIGFAKKTVDTPEEKGDN